jgi:hypothetical protein
MVPYRPECRFFQWPAARLEYEPCPLPHLFELPPDNDWLLRQHTRATRFIARRVVRTARPLLSDRKRLDELDARLLERIECLRQDYLAGRFHDPSPGRASSFLHPVAEPR